MHTREDGGRAVPVHDAVGLIWFDEPQKRYLMRSMIQTGQTMEFEIKVKEHGYEWGYPDPRRKGEIRYTANFTDHEWREYGEFSADGQTWKKFYEMNLQRAK